MGLQITNILTTVLPGHNLSQLTTPENYNSFYSSVTGIASIVHISLRHCLNYIFLLCQSKLLYGVLAIVLHKVLTCISVSFPVCVSGNISYH